MNNLIGKKFRDTRFKPKIIVEIIDIIGKKENIYKTKIIKSENSYVVEVGSIHMLSRKLFDNKYFIPIQNKIKKL